MKTGLQIGAEAEVTATVTREMFAQFEGTIVHRAYSTVAMVYHMEWASRKIILPYLEDHEEGVGGAVSVKHIAPTAEGTVVHVKAVVTGMTKNVIVTAVEIRNETGLIGVGEVKQGIVLKETMENRLKQSVMKQGSNS
ncbi:thioesterase family protein [Pradoshia sp.]